jgi:hypothetical protein
MTGSLSFHPTQHRRLAANGPGRRLARRTAFSTELWTFSPPLYSTNPSLRNRFMKKLTLERVVPMIPARVSWLILGMTV